jgi:bacterioferritin-associated ferredoxin
LCLNLRTALRQRTGADLVATTAQLVGQLPDQGPVGCGNCGAELRELVGELLLIESPHHRRRLRRLHPERGQ